ncbi:unnamed protein product (macronuclear) [Paramecium tetraurelia]|uniref:DH domain-containing protein n=1 Tax=Paramecium tetraurelia TaxID=5888 RepID=A0D4V7_PARTE|nr:uncharacterized protein GSPATT00013521001 [Paramecium tetraurelia]CAK78074.1 unnamed protein product [Paramecium tetraurelia]|eukprot:XP_001445471.1 hypothetical protein (macronuclear) [Paramecium tetraurelia strain d4-2]
MKQSQMNEKDYLYMLQSQDVYGKEDYRLTNQTGCTEHSKSQSLCFDQVILGSSQILNIPDLLLDKYQSIWKKKIIIIQSHYKGHLQRKKYKNMKKWAKYRKNVYLELIMTEKDYLADLKSIIHNVMIAADQFQLLPENEIQITFNVLQGYLVQDLIFILEQFSHYHPNSCFGNVLERFIPYFKIYFKYYYEYKDYQIRDLRQAYPAFDNHLNILEQGNLFRGCDLNSFLVKPVQRLPKYALLLKDLVKHTWKTHPDYDKLIKTLESFHSVTGQIDKQMGSILRNQALFDLQKKFFDVLSQNIVESTRNFILTEPIYLLRQGQEELVQLYLCSDLIVLSKKTQVSEQRINERLLEYAFLDEKSYLEEDKNEVLQLAVCNQDKDDKFIFLCQDLEQKQRLFQEFFQIIKMICEKYFSQTISIQQEQKNQPIRVFVTSISRGQSRMPFKTFAKYNLSVVLDKKEYITWTRHKILLRIQKALKKQYKKEYLTEKDTNILFQDYIEKNLNKQNSDGRKVIVETFVETLLNSCYLKSAPESYLQFLGLPLGFYQNNQNVSQMKSTIVDSESSKSSQDS